MRFLKEYVIVFIIVLLIIVIEIITSKSLNNSVEWINNEIGSIENKIKEEDNKSAEDKFKKFKKEWNEKENQLSIFIEHNELEKVSKDIIQIESCFENEEHKKALENIAELKFTVKHIHEKNQLKLKNIF